MARSRRAPQREPKPTVILISIEGLRHDYIDLADTPNFDRPIDAGVNLPREEQPSLVTLYMSLVDVAAHDHGPERPEVVAAVRDVDSIGCGAARIEWTLRALKRDSHGPRRHAHLED